jgi:large subunit ribosomal protein L13e
VCRLVNAVWCLQGGDSAAEELSVASQLKAKLLPITKAAPKIESVKVTPEMQAVKAYATLRLERMNARMVGIRAKKAADAEKEKEAAAK